MQSIIVTSDIVGSSLLKATSSKRLVEVMNNTVEKIQQQNPKVQAEIFRGDSIQLAWKKDTFDALRLVMWMHMQFLKEGFEIRSGIGFGAITLQTGKLGTSNGTAFVQSGDMLDSLKNTNVRIAIASTSVDESSEWQTHAAALNYVLHRCTVPQAEAIALQLEDKAQIEIASLLGIKQPAVHQRLQAGGWPVFQAILKRFEYIATK